MQTILEKSPGGGFNALASYRVSQIANDAKPPEGATVVADDTPTTDGWQQADPSFVWPAPKAPAPPQTATQEGA